MVSGNKPIKEGVDENHLTPPGMSENAKKTIVVNGHNFTFHKRTFGDFIKIRAYAINLIGMYTSADLAAELVARRGIEYKVAELAICLTEAPEHWKSFNELLNQTVISPEQLDFDGKDADEFSEVYQELVKFLDSFRKS